MSSAVRVWYLLLLLLEVGSSVWIGGSKRNTSASGVVVVAWWSGGSGVSGKNIPAYLFPPFYPHDLLCRYYTCTRYHIHVQTGECAVFKNKDIAITYTDLTYRYQYANLVNLIIYTAHDIFLTYHFASHLFWLDLLYDSSTYRYVPYPTQWHAAGWLLACKNKMIYNERAVCMFSFHLIRRSLSLSANIIH